jgi:hypothetical protein
VIGFEAVVETAGWKDNILKRIFALSAALVALLLVGVPIASASIIEIPINTVVRAEVGSTTLLTTYNTPTELVGVNCLVTATAKNQSSTHPNNDLIVASGTDSITLLDVERSGGVVTESSEYLTLGPAITVSLRMGPDKIFSGGLVVNLECPPPDTSTTTTTSTPTTTTTEPTTTTTGPGTTTTVQATPPAILIEKTATPEYYGEDGVGNFTIKVTNPGPVDLIDVHVTDDVAEKVDANSDCPNPEIPDLAVGDSYTYECSVSNLDGVSPFTNEATAIGTGPDGTEVDDTDDATVFPPVLSTTITQPPPTSPPATVPPTLPVTGVPFEHVRGFSIAALGFILGGISLLGVAALMARQRVLQGNGYHEVWLELKPKSHVRTFHITLRRKH